MRNVRSSFNCSYNPNQIANFDSLLFDFSYLAFILTFTTNVGMYYLFKTKFKQEFQLWSNVKEK